MDTWMDNLLLCAIAVAGIIVFGPFAVVAWKYAIGA